MKKLFAVSVITLMFAGCLFAQDKYMINELTGTWDYTAENAPYEYQQGKLIFGQKDKELSAKIDIQGNIVAVRDLKIAKKNISFVVYVDGERVAVNLTLKEGKLEGTGETYEGPIPLEAVKKK